MVYNGEAVSIPKPFSRFVIEEWISIFYGKIYNVKTRIIRIFNTYGPGMEINDGRVISNFLVNIINKKELIVYGDGKQTRSFCYVDDLVRGLINASKVDFDFPINLGNNNEISLNKLIEDTFLFSSFKLFILFLIKFICLIIFL